MGTKWAKGSLGYEALFQKLQVRETEPSNTRKPRQEDHKFKTSQGNLERLSPNIFLKAETTAQW